MFHTCLVANKKAVLVIAYNRPHAATQVVEAIREYSPSRLYVACDGPKPNQSEDAEKVGAVRQIMANPGWDCRVTTLFRPANLGLRVAVTDALDWFFDQEDEGIILEDDCVPSPDFFRLAEYCLDTYRDEERVWGMTGSNTANVTMSTDASYGFIQHPLIWGWATWANRWKRRDFALHSYPGPVQAAQTAHWPSRHHKHTFYRQLTSMQQTGTPSTWDYPWSWTVMSQRGLWIVPNSQLVQNIGFGADATNTEGSALTGPKVSPLGPIATPQNIEQNMTAELEILRTIHRLKRHALVNSLRFAARVCLSMFRRKTAPIPQLPGVQRVSI